MTKLYPGDKVRAAKSHPFYEEIKDDVMIVVALELANDLSHVRAQTATGTSKGFSHLPWENWKSGWHVEDLEHVEKPTPAPAQVAATTVVTPTPSPTPTKPAKANAA